MTWSDSRAAQISAGPFANEVERAAVRNLAARLLICIPWTSLPSPHTDPARKRSVGKAVYGPAVVHCNAYDSSLSVASSGADMKNDVAKHRLCVDFKVNKPLDQTFGSHFDFLLSLIELFRGAVQRCRWPSGPMTVPTYLACLAIFISRNSSQCAEIQSSRSWQLSLPYCTQQHCR